MDTGKDNKYKLSELNPSGVGGCSLLVSNKEVGGREKN